MRSRPSAAATLFALAAACSAQEKAGAPPATLDERRALAQAEAMIPADERSTKPEETPTP